jgi:hypothetical protein
MYFFFIRAMSLMGSMNSFYMCPISSGGSNYEAITEARRKARRAKIVRRR